VSRNKTETKIKESCWLGHGDDETVRSRGNGEDILSETPGMRFRRLESSKGGFKSSDIFFFYCSEILLPV